VAVGIVESVENRPGQRQIMQGAINTRRVEEGRLDPRNERARLSRTA